MAHTCNQYFDSCIIALNKVNEKTKKYISDLTSNIATINFWLITLEELPEAVTHLTAMCQQSQEAMNNLTTMFK
jgi:hypothetical protein